MLRISQAASSDAGTGGAVWPAASVTCRWLARHADPLQGTSVLELGCGTGACGLFAAGLGAKRVLLTDNSESVLQNARRNIADCAMQTGSCYVEAQRLSFGDSTLPAGRFDWVLASDCVYGTEWKALAQTLRALLLRQADSPPRVILAIPHRHPGALLSESFLANAKGLRLVTLDVERAPEHNGGQRSSEAGAPTETVAVHVVEVKLDR